MIHIRDATASDHALLVDFSKRLASETEGKTLDPAVLGRGVATALAEPDRLRFWVAELDGKVVGQTAITREWSDWRNGWIWWLQSVYVVVESRNHGIFRRLYQHISETAKAEPDVLGLRLYVEQENIRAQQTYRSLGMKPGGYHVYEAMWPERLGGNAERSDR